MKTYFVRACLAVSFALCASGGSKADVLFDSLSGATVDVDSILDGGPLAASFSTGNTAVSLTDVKVLLTNGGLFGSGTVDVSLLSDAGTAPGSVLATIGSISDANIDDTLKVFDVTVGTPYALAANTRYWIELSTTDDSTAYWAYTNDTSGTGVANEYFSNYGNVYSNSDGPYQMLVQAPVPEPSAVLTFGIGCISCFWTLSKRKARSASKLSA